MMPTLGSMLVWINGTISPPEEARISVFDRGFMYGDAVYELVRFFGGEGFGLDLHVERLRSNLARTGIGGFDADLYPAIAEELLDGLGDGDATVYLQVTRGVQMPRRHLPADDLTPTVVAVASLAKSLEDLERPAGVTVAIHPDLRRVHCDVKATSLLENVLATMSASESGAQEPILEVGGQLTEGASSSIFLVDRGSLRTPRLDEPRPILPGISRRLVVEVAEELGIECREEAVTAQELREAGEAFLTSSSRVLAPVTRVDGTEIGSGTAGEVTLRIHRALVERIRGMSALHSGA